LSNAWSAWGRVVALSACLLPSCRLQDENLAATAAGARGGPGTLRPAPPPAVPPPLGSNPDPIYPPPVGAPTATPAGPPAAGTDAGGAAVNPGLPPATGGAPDAAPSQVVAPPAFAVAEVATWRNAAAGAYSIIHGSVCDSSAAGGFLHADPELVRRGLQAGFSVIVGSCGQAPGGEWPKVKALFQHGHDIVNQSFSFACLGGRACGGGQRASLDFAMEIDQATRALEMHTAAPVRFFAFPFDACGPEAVAHLKQRGYFGARCGGRGISDANLADGFLSKFDVWGPSYSIYGVMNGPCMGAVVANANQAPQSLPPACRQFVLNKYVDDAIAGKGWAIRTLTGFQDDGAAFQPISVGDYTAHLDYIKGRSDAGQLWVAGPTTVLKYRFARERCPLPTVEGNTLRFAPPSEACQPYVTTLSYVVTALGPNPPASLTVTQAHSTAAARTLARGRYLVNADPSLGDVELAP
jgi:hypothetical protein